MAVELALDLIRIDGGTQPRAELNQEAVEDYTQGMQEGDIFPPVVVFYDGTNYWLADGFHRYHAKKQIEAQTILAEIKQGDLDTAIEHSCGVNAKHGIRRTKGDIRRAIERLVKLPKWQNRTQKDIAKQCGSTQPYISKILADLGYNSYISPTNPPVEPTDTENEERIRTPENDTEKRETVDQFFADFPGSQELSNREIAKRCGVSEGLVRKVKKDLQEEAARNASVPMPAPEPQPVTIPVINPEPATESEPEIASDPEPAIEETEEPEPAPIAISGVIIPSEETLIEREIKRQQTQERNDQLREKGAELPKDKYACLVVDPPWPMKKIEREVRPNQVEFDYPTMSEQELRDFDLPSLTGDDCHLYLWTTQKYLPMAFRLAEHWGFKYQCLMTWVKNVGPTPFSWMYTTEHVLFCSKGDLPLLALGRRLDFVAKGREHSRKPDVFYDLVREVSPGPRLDVFSRERRDGFKQYGYEVEKYASA